MKSMMFLAVALVGCASSDSVEPVLSETTTEIAFDVWDSEIGEYGITIDVATQTLRGSWVARLADGRLCRRTIGNGSMDGAMAGLRTALETSELVTLGDDSCQALGGCGGGVSHDLGVRVDGGERYTADTPCRQLRQSQGLESALYAAAQAMPGVDQEVVWNGEEYRVVGDCAAFGEPRRGY